MPDTTDLRNKILEFKERENLSYQTMADLIKVSKSEVHQAVTGSRTNPKSNIIISKLIQAYGI
ncbi:helix-turn-helix domain-containing protein [Enterococcus gallinarum]|uniref:helix-turn-helix domain-containing protein n=1 Tax=Enterococcus gallinarum TaxID=1353 RepID=UPI0015C53ABF|nr:helix-turn-helix domain-containing protein [Enterococcus gallinarum]NQE01816.1 helix-turn-helix domain-containing protein [Enterococcus gallinarum]